MLIDPNRWPGPKKAGLRVDFPRINWVGVVLPICVGVLIGLLILWLLP